MICLTQSGKFKTLGLFAHGSLQASYKSTKVMSRSKFNPKHMKQLRAESAKTGPGLKLGEPLGLHNLFRSPGSNKERKRYRGIASGGRTNGRGHKGQNSRSGGRVPKGFEGGQTPFYMTRPKFGFKNNLQKDYQTINLDTLQRWIDIGRLDASQPITIKALYDAGIGRVKDGVKILGDGAARFTHQVTVEASRLSASAVRRIEELGGTAVAIHYNELGLRVLTRPEAIIYRKTKTPLAYRQFMEDLLTKHESLSPKTRHSDEEEAISKTNKANLVTPDPSQPSDSKHDVSFKKHATKMVAGVYDPLDPSLGKASKEALKQALSSQSKPTHYAQRLLSLLPRFASPVASKDIEYYTSDEKRGYLSPMVLERYGKLAYTLMHASRPTATPSLYRKLGLNYWIQRKHVVLTRDPEEYRQVLVEHGYPTGPVSSRDTKKATRDVSQENLQEQRGALAGLGLAFRQDFSKRFRRRGLPKITVEPIAIPGAAPQSSTTPSTAQKVN